MSRFVVPGVQIEGTAAGPPSITPGDTSVTALLGPADRGPLHQVVEVRSLTDVERTYGGATDSRLGRACADFLANGGERALVVRTEQVTDALAALSVAPPFQLLVIDPAVLGSRDLAEADALCEERRAFLVADAEPETAGEVPADLTAVQARNAAVYFPQILDETGRPRPVAPSVAGVFARNDRSRGVWRASAGTSAAVAGAVDVATRLTDRELDKLTRRNVNALRRMPDGTVVVWGDRTVSTDPEWKYVNVRRFLLFLEHSIEQGLEWVAFEPNTEALWDRVRSSVDDFLTRLWRHGAFPGAKPREAFFVDCDASTMTEDDIRSGRLVLLVGVATIRPAEFVVIRIARRTGH